MSNDNIIILLFILVLVTVVGISIVSIIDRKLSNIEIIIPPLSKDEKPRKVIVNSSENFINNTTTTKSETLQESEIKSNIIDQQDIIKKETESISNLLNPDEANVVEYDKYVCIKKEKMEKKENTKNSEIENKDSVGSIKCKNESLNNKYTYGVKSLDPFPLGNQKSWYDIDPSQYYRKYKPIAIPIEDKLIKGYNESSYVKSSGVYDIGKINLNDNKQKYAQPNNYILRN